MLCEDSSILAIAVLPRVSFVACYGTPVVFRSWGLILSHLSVADTKIFLIDIVVFIQACTDVVFLSEWEPGREYSCLIQYGLRNWRQLLESRAPRVFQVVHFIAVT